jgi:hypothetical protein
MIKIFLLQRAVNPLRLSQEIEKVPWEIKEKAARSVSMQLYKGLGIVSYGSLSLAPDPHRPSRQPSFAPVGQREVGQSSPQLGSG